MGNSTMKFLVLNLSLLYQHCKSENIAIVCQVLVRLCAFVLEDQQLVQVCMHARLVTSTHTQTTSSRVNCV
jgi:hypothetical protein